MLRRRKKPEPYPLVIDIGGYKLHVADCMRHVLLTGSPGSGKSWLLLMIIEQLARMGVPLYITTTKITDFADIERICRKIGALERLVRLGLPDPDRLKPKKLDIGEFFTETLPGGGARVIAYHTQLAGEVLKNSSGGSKGDEFWSGLINDLILHSTNLAIIAEGQARLDRIHDIIISPPSSKEEVESDWYYTDTVCGRMLEKAKRNRQPHQERSYEQLVHFFTGKIATIGDKARGAAIQGAGSALSGLVSDPFWGQVCNGSNWSPEAANRSRLITVIDGCPMMNFSAGAAFNFLHVAAIQAWAMARDPASIDVPDILIRDECGFILTALHDAKVLAGCRGQKLGCIDAVQSLPTLQMVLGGSQEQMQSFLGLHAIKVAFSNACTTTNEAMSKLCGDELQIMSGGGGGGCQPSGRLMDDILGVNQNFNWHVEYQPAVRPEFFTTCLPTGTAVLHAFGGHRVVDLRSSK